MSYSFFSFKIQTTMSCEHTEYFQEVPGCSSDVSTAPREMALLFSLLL